jgi:hypothetical protein
MHVYNPLRHFGQGIDNVGRVVYNAGDFSGVGLYLLNSCFNGV